MPGLSEKRTPERIFVILTKIPLLWRTATNVAEDASSSRRSPTSFARPTTRRWRAGPAGPFEVSAGIVETGVRHPPQPAADDEVATVRRHRVLHGPSGRLPLWPGSRLLRCGLPGRLLASDRHQHLLLAGRRFFCLFGRLFRGCWRGRVAAATGALA
jgi:hypothetical protein